MKLAFLFLVIDRINHLDIWKKFLKGHENKYNIYIHSKKKLLQEDLENYKISNIIPTNWGDFSLVSAYMELLKEAVKDKSNYKFILCSNSCIPIKTFDMIFDTLTKNNMSFITNKKSRHDKKTLDKRYTTLKQSDFIPRKYYKKSDQWIILSQNIANIILQTRQKYEPIFINSIIPDEHYIATVLFIELKKEYYWYISNEKTTLVDWNRPSDNHKHPHTFEIVTKEDIKLLRNSCELFARKFTVESDISKYIENIWKSNKCLPFGNICLYEMTEIGSGYVGKIYLVKHHNKNFAVKIIPHETKYDSYKDRRHQINKEINILKRLRDKLLTNKIINFPLYYYDTTCIIKNKLRTVIIMDYIKYNLTEWLKDNNSEQHYLVFIFQVLTAIYYMNFNLNINHNDLHIENILVKKHSKGGYYHYKIKDDDYYVPNIGAEFIIIDFDKSISFSNSQIDLEFILGNIDDIKTTEHNKMKYLVDNYSITELEQMLSSYGIKYHFNDKEQKYHRTLSWKLINNKKFDELYKKTSNDAKNKLNKLEYPLSIINRFKNIDLSLNIDKILKQYFKDFREKQSDIKKNINY
jgi:hypothetical protein